MKGVFHKIEEDLESTESWIDEGLCKFEALLANHWAFDCWIEDGA